MLAVSNSQLEVATMLLQNGFSPFATLPLPRGWSLLFFAAASKNPATVQFCLNLGLSPCFRASVGVASK